jgi:hypothetical protein
MSEPPAPYWGNLLKSNSNGTYFGVAIENVNRNDRGFVDFEKMIGLDGIALVNIVSNAAEATVSGEKHLQTRITHNDGMFGRFAIYLVSSYYIQEVPGRHSTLQPRIHSATNMNVKEL